MALSGIGASSGPVSTAASSSPVSTIRIILPLIGLGFAVIVNAAWIGFLGYCLLKPSRTSFRRSITSAVLFFPFQIELAKIGRRIRSAVVSKVQDYNVRVAFSEHLHRARLRPRSCGVEPASRGRCRIPMPRRLPSVGPADGWKFDDGL